VSDRGEAGSDGDNGVGRWLREHASAVARIARWEVSRGVASVDRRVLVLGVIALVVAGGVAGAAAALGGGVALDSDIYRVGVDSGSAYHDPVAASTPLEASDPDPAAFARGDLDLLLPTDPAVREGELPVVAVDPARASPDAVQTELQRGRAVVRDSRKGQAALSSFRDAVEGYNDRRLRAEPNQTAAFPVVVSLRYVERTEVETDVSETGGDSGAGSGGDGGGAGGSVGGDGGSGADSSGEGAGDGSASGDGGSGLLGGLTGPLPVPNVGAGGLFATDSTGSPADIQPPFPFASLVLAFAFLIPMNFVIQAYGSTILDERINRRGELLLVAPVSPGDIIAGKTAPYLLGAVLTTALIALAVGGGILSVLAVLPVALLYLAATFVGGMFARSFKELTFVTVAVSVFLTTYTFVPAIFTEVTPIALISPLTLVVRDLQGGGATLGQFLFSTGPFFLVASLLFLLGSGVYREEDMFTQRSVPLKFLDALDARLSGKASVAVVTALTIPFVFVAELLAVAVLFALPFAVSLPVLLVTIAAIEEVAKSAHVYAGFHKARFSRTATTALALGGLSGVGFFVGEKATVVVQLVGLPDLPLGEAAFAPAGIGLAGAVGLLLAPLALHAGTAMITALGASRGHRLWYLGTLVLATGVHALYNLSVVVLLG
jgi:ABC-type Na+ efflux pump permease subunit